MILRRSQIITFSVSLLLFACQPAASDNKSTTPAAAPAPAPAPDPAPDPEPQPCGNSLLCDGPPVDPPVLEPEPQPCGGSLLCVQQLAIDLEAHEIFSTIGAA